MDQPLGAAVGNALEVREALDTVRGHGPADFTELVLDACAKLLALSDLGIDEGEGRRRAESAVADGARPRRRGGAGSRRRAAPRTRRRSPSAPVRREVGRAARRVSSQALSAIGVGIAAVHLGAGRRTKDDSIDHAVGIVCRAKRGERVEAGEVLAEVHARDRGGRRSGRADVLAAYELGDEAPEAAAAAARGRLLTAPAARRSSSFGPPL